MTHDAAVTLTAHFAALDDPRVERTRLHPLLSIVTIALCGVLCGASSWDEIAEFGEGREEWFARFVPLPHGIPSHDTFNRVFAALDPRQFRACFQQWMQAVAGVLPTQVIALDGKTLRGSRDPANGRAAIHMVSAWATANQLVLAQEKVDAKSNEITALPLLLRQLALAGCIVTIDAMGCQRTIAQQIVDQHGAYVLALKGNQGSLQEDVQDSFAQAQATRFAEVTHDYAETLDKGHGRLERRQHWVLTDAATLAWLQAQHQWPGLAALGLVVSERRLDGSATREERYYLLSDALSAVAFGAAVRSHWGIENQVHWVLDMTFGEDRSRIRTGYAAENFAVLRHLALNLLQRHPTTSKASIKTRRFKAATNESYLFQILADV
jgi:predicted transposase YbfD/YdcC